MHEAYGLAIPTALADICHPSRTALIVYDMQAGVVSQIEEGRPVTERCREILSAARTANYRVYFTRHMWLPNRLAGVGQFRRAMVWQRAENPLKTKPPFEVGSAPWQIVPELAPTPDEGLIDKITMSAFEGTFLDIAMRDAGLQSFIIVGIALEVGIGPTVFQGLDLNYTPIVVTDACGARTAAAKERVLTSLEETGEVVLVETARIIGTLTHR